MESSTPKTPALQEEDCCDAEPPESLQIDIADEHPTYSAPGAVLRDAVRAALLDSPVQSAVISVAVVDDPAIHVLNRRHLQHDYPTDVLSFLLERSPAHLEGEIVISADTAAREAADAGWSTDDELALYVVHGMLHLLGHEDQQAADAQRMCSAEADLLARLGIARSATDSRWSADSLPPPANVGGPNPL
ncbi:rRNA maturation RNase YbeY [Pirellulales bacterium]|nr:rRNA maturation RNase YbeY [Pirellulales bacterium]